MYESSSASPPPPEQPPSATSSEVSTRTDPENLSPASRLETHPKKRRRRSSVPVNLSIDTKNDDTSVTQSNWRVSRVSIATINNNRANACRTLLGSFNIHSTPLLTFDNLLFYSFFSRDRLGKIVDKLEQ